MTQFDPDSEIEPEEEGGEEETEGAQPQSRTFLIAVIALGGLFAVGVICIGVVMFYVVPRNQAAFNETATAISAANAETGTAVVLANIPTDTPPPPPTTEVAVLFPSETPTSVFGASVEPSITPTDTASPTASDTVGPSLTPSRTPTPINVTKEAQALTATAQGQSLIGGTPTRIPGVVTVTATFTRAPTRSTPGTGTPGGGGGEFGITPTSTALAQTGFAEDVGGPGLFLLAIGLIAALFVVRRLRMQNS